MTKTATTTKKALKVAAVWKGGEVFARIVCDGIMPAGEQATALMLGDEPVALVHGTDMVVLEEPSADDMDADSGVFGGERLGHPAVLDVSLAKANNMLFSAPKCGGDCKCEPKTPGEVKAAVKKLKKAAKRNPKSRIVKTGSPKGGCVPLGI